MKPLRFSSLPTLCLLLVLDPAAMSASRTLDKTEVPRVQYLVVTSTVSGEIICKAQRLSPLFTLRAAVSLRSVYVPCAAPPLARLLVGSYTSILMPYPLRK